MKNRALLLCLKNNIEFIEEYAFRIGVSMDTARGILDETIIIPDDIVKRNCELFGVSKEYFLCLI